MRRADDSCTGRKSTSHTRNEENKTEEEKKILRSLDFFSVSTAQHSKKWMQES